MFRYFYIAFVLYIPILTIFIPTTKFGPGIPEITIERIFFYFLVVAFFLEIFYTKTRVIIFSKWLATLFVFSLIVLASISWSNYFYNYSTLQMIFWKVFVPLFVAFLAHHLFRDRQNIDLYIKNISICSVILSSISIFKMIISLTTGNIYFRAGAGDASSLANPNALAIFLVLTLPCTIYGVENKIIPKVLGRHVTLSVVLGIICTISRKGFITMILVFFIHYFLRKQFKRLIVLGILCTAFVPILLAVTTFSNRWSEDQLLKAYEGKATMVMAGLDMFKRSPFIGHGFKGYHRLFHQYFPISRHARYDAHNIYITALANYGIVGFIPFISIFLYPLLLSSKILRNNIANLTTLHSKQMAIICIASIVPFMLSGWYAGGLFYQPEKLFLLYSQITFTVSSNTWRYRTPDPSRHEI